MDRTDNLKIIKWQMSCPNDLEEPKWPVNIRSTLKGPA